LAVFNGANPNGQWGLYVIDDSLGNTGIISNGWVLNLVLANPVGSNSDLGLTMAGPAQAVLTSNITYTLTVTNFGPALATAVAVSNFMPLPFVSATTASGTATNLGGGVLLWQIGNLATNGYASLTLVLSAAVAGTVTNTATVSSANVDLNPANDTASVVTTVITPSADLSLSLVANPSPAFLGGNITYTITISNAGPATATAVVVTNQLPQSATFVSASPGYTLSAGTVTFTTLGSIGSGDQSLATVVVQAPLAQTTLIDSAGCFSTVFDPTKGDNKATIKTLVTAVPVALGRQGGNFLISWPMGTGNYILETTTNLASPAAWTAVTNLTVTQVAGQNNVLVPVGNSRQFFRLRAPAP